MENYILIKQNAKGKLFRLQFLSSYFIENFNYFGQEMHLVDLDLVCELVSEALLKINTWGCVNFENRFRNLFKDSVG